MTKVGLIRIVLTSLFFLFPKIVSAQIVINEIGPLSSPDWVEIYNFSPESVDLTGYILRDSSVTNEFSLSGELGPGGFVVFDWSNRLNNSGDIVKLVSKADSQVIEEVPYGDKGGVCLPTEFGSIGKPIDGGNTIERFLASSRGLTNSGSTLDPCPAPTSVPTSTSSPTPTQKPIVTNSPSPTFKPTKKPSPTRVPPELREVEAGGDQDSRNLEVKGVFDSEDSKEVDGNKSSFPTVPLLLSVVGLFLIMVALVTYIKQKKLTAAK